jgi:hypothetical protein
VLILFPIHDPGEDHVVGEAIVLPVEARPEVER